LRDVLVLALLFRRFALVTRAPAENARDEIVVLVHEMRFDVLDREPPGEFAVLDVDTDDALFGADAIAGAEIPEDLPVVPRVEPVHAGEAPARAAEPAVRHREHRRRDHARVTAVAAVLGIAV